MNSASRILSLLCVAWASAWFGCGKSTTVVASKSFTESVVLGEIVVAEAKEVGVPITHRADLGGTTVIWQGLLSGEIDVYGEYTGTILKQILQTEERLSWEEIRDKLAEKNIRITKPLGFSNNYALAMKRDRAKERGITRMSDLAAHPNLSMGFSNEFVDREDGWPAVRARYGLKQAPAGMQHSLAYEAIDGGSIDVMDIYTTDALAARYDLLTLEDDLRVFPDYAAVYAYRDDLRERAPKLVAALENLGGQISRQDIVRLNSLVDSEGVREWRAAQLFIEQDRDVDLSEMDLDSLKPGWEERFALWASRFLRFTGQHLLLVVISLSGVIAVGVPLGVVAAKRPLLSPVILGLVEAIQTIPGLALLVLLMAPIRLVGLQGIGATPTIIALFLYSLLPIVRNTYTGIHDIAPGMRESADAIGLPPWDQLWQIELPLASRLILAGIKTAAVINVGYATLGALIGAGGYGEPILNGIRLVSIPLMLEGAIPAAVMAIGVKLLFEWSEPWIVPEGLRLRAGHK